VLSVRPKVAELSFQLYGRSLHPELFETHQTRTLSRGGYTAQVNITSAGHVITWQYAGMTLTEVAASSHQPLPERRRLLSRQLTGERKDKVQCRGGIEYRFNFSLETVDPRFFRSMQQELMVEGSEYQLIHNFDSSGRMALGAFSFINMEARDRSVLFQVLHTFPDDGAIVKTESQFQLP